MDCSCGSSDNTLGSATGQHTCSDGNTFRLTLKYTTCKGCGRIGSEVLYKDDKPVAFGTNARSAYTNADCITEQGDPRDKSATHHATSSESPLESCSTTESQHGEVINHPFKQHSVYLKSQPDTPVCKFLVIDKLYEEYREVTVPAFNLEFGSNDRMKSWCDMSKKTLSILAEMYQCDTSDIKIYTTCTHKSTTPMIHIDSEESTEISIPEERTADHQKVVVNRQEMTEYFEAVNAEVKQGEQMGLF